MIYLLFISFLFAMVYVVLLRKYSSLWVDIEESQIVTVDASVCILIPFRNEEKHLKSLLLSLQASQYESERLKVIFINDHSEDNSVNIIESFPLKHAKQILHLENAVGKKEAIKKAWEVTDCDIYIHTDADCAVPTKWIDLLLSPFHNENTMFVSGPVKFANPKSFFERLVSLDFIALIAIGAAHIYWRKPLICNGANLAYRSSALGEVDLNHQHSSGDDVFLMQSISNKHPNSIAFVKSKSAIVETIAPASWNNFIQQRIRWASKNTAYNSKENTAILAFSWLFNVLILGSFLTFTSIGFLIGLFLIMLKLYAEINFYDKISNFFDLKNWIITSIVGQLFHIPYMALLPIVSKLKKYEWKGRKLK